MTTPDYKPNYRPDTRPASTTLSPWKARPLPWPETIREAIAAAVRASDGSKSQQRRIELLKDLLKTAEEAWK